MASQKMVELLHLCLASTERGNLDWMQVGGDAFEIRQAAGLIRVDSEDGDGLRPFRFLALDSEGRTLDVLTQYNDDDGQAAEAWVEAITALYEAARRGALNIDPLLDNLIAELKASPVEGS